MKIADGPKYQKRGSPLRQKQRRAAQLAAQVFAELLPHVCRAVNRRRAAPKPPALPRLPCQK